MATTEAAERRRSNASDAETPVQQTYKPVDAVRGVPKFMEESNPAARRHARPVGRRDPRREPSVDDGDHRAAAGEKIAWKTIAGEVNNDGVVTFEQVENSQTRVNLQMDVEGDTAAESVAGDLLGIVK
jgi:hypothetical protein